LSQIINKDFMLGSWLEINHTVLFINKVILHLLFEFVRRYRLIPWNHKLVE